MILGITASTFRETVLLRVGTAAGYQSRDCQGKSLDEVIAAKPTAAYDAKWGGFVIDPAFFTRLVYAGV